MQPWAEHAGFAALVERLEKQRRPLRPAVNGDDRPGLDDAGQVEELIVLAERLLTRPFGRALEDRNGVTNLCHDPRASCREFLERKDFRAGEHRLSRRRDREDQQAGDQDEEPRPTHPGILRHLGRRSRFQSLQTTVASGVS